MNTLLHVSAPIAWFDALAHLAVKGTAILAVFFFIGFAMRRLSAAMRYLSLLAAVLSLNVLAFALVILPHWQVIPKPKSEAPLLPMPNDEIRVPLVGNLASEMLTPNPHAKPSKPGLPSVTASSTSTTAAITSATSEPNTGWQIMLLNRLTWDKIVRRLPLLWLVGVGLLGLRIVLNVLRLLLLELRCAGADTEPELSASVISVAREMGLGSATRPMPRLLIGTATAMPMVWGVLWPRLLLPISASQWSPDRLRAVWLHEFAHLQRRDPAALLLAQAMQVLHWFNPLAWVAVHRLRTTQELACDDAVLHHGIRASDYAQHLLDLSQQHRIPRGISLCSLAITRTDPVEQRLLAILDRGLKRRAMPSRITRSVLLTSAVLSLPLAMLAVDATPPQRGKILDRNGIVLVENRQGQPRNHPLKALAAHVLGYTGSDSPENKTKPDGPRRGRAGLEKTADKTLAAGFDVTTTLDARIQSIVEQAMRDAGVGRGAAIVLSPNTGDVLAMASFPNYDPGSFEPSLSLADFETLIDDKTIPLLPRAINAYSPGSAFKPFIALAAATQGLGDETFECTGSVTYGSHELKCWIARQFDSKHGVLNLEDALMRSCNCYFYQLGNRTGITAMGKAGQLMGIGEQTHIQLPDEAPGLLPTPEWLELNQPNEKSPSSIIIANTSVGQGFVLASPLQMAVLAATVATAGKVPAVSLLPRPEPIKSPADLIQNGVTPEQMERIRKGMWKVVNHESGTAKSARVPGIEVAGKTGTAQFWRVINGNQVADNHAWFIGFAPYKNPTLAFAILVQGGKSGGSTCAPIAQRIIEQSLALPADGSGKVKPSEVHQGHFKAVDDTSAKLTAAPGNGPQTTQPTSVVK